MTTVPGLGVELAFGCIRNGTRVVAPKLKGSKTLFRETQHLKGAASFFSQPSVSFNMFAV